MKRCCRILACFLLLCTCLACGGCWDYRGLDELTIVAGFALDESPDGGYLLSLEIIDSASAGTDKTSSKIIQAHGLTIADAVYNVSTQFHNNVYFGNADVLIVSNKLVEKVDFNDLIDSLLRDNGMRDNLIILVSGEETACEIITPEENELTIISFDINNKFLNNQKSVTVTRSKELYEIYGILARQASDLMLPVIRFKSAEEKKLIIDGLAVFHGSLLAGYLDQEDVQEYLLMVESLTGGGYILTEKNVGGEDSKITIAIRSSKPKIKYEYHGEALKYTFDIDMIVSTVEFNSQAFQLYRNTQNDLDRLKDRLEERIAQSVREMVENYLKNGPESDIFGFANEIYYHNPKLWAKLKNDWTAQYRNIQVDINCDVTIYDTGLMKRR